MTCIRSGNNGVFCVGDPECPPTNHVGTGDAMKEYQLRCSDDEVRAIQAGLQTQVRLPVPEKWIPIVEEVLRVNGKWTPNTLGYDLTSPFGVPGDRLWIRSAYRVSYDHFYNEAHWHGPDDCGMWVTTRGKPLRKDGKPMHLGCKPATQMPYWLSAEAWPQLEVLDVRVEWDENQWVWVGTFRKLNDNTEGKTR